MHMSNNGISLLQSYEGCHLTAYWDVNGYAIGYGHHGNVNKGDTITQARATELLRQDIAQRYEPAVNKYVGTYNLNQNEFDALVDFCYNCGAGNLNKLLQNGKASREQIRAVLPQYNRAGGKVLNGLVKRRNAELQLFNTPIAVQQTSNVYYPKYTGNSMQVDVVLREVGAPYGNWRKRIPIATANGIANYVGSYQQNINIINKAKAGTLRRV